MSGSVSFEKGCRIKINKQTKKHTSKYVLQSSAHSSSTVSQTTDNSNKNVFPQFVRLKRIRLYYLSCANGASVLLSQNGTKSVTSSEIIVLLLLCSGTTTKNIRFRNFFSPPPFIFLARQKWRLQSFDSHHSSCSDIM